MAREDHRSRRAPSRRDLLSAIRCLSCFAPGSAPRAIGGIPETSGHEIAAADSLASGAFFAMHAKLRKMVASKLILDWSPEQISGWLKIQYPADESMRVSHETIYRSLFIQARGVLKKELLGHLRSKRRIRRSQHARIYKDARGQIVDAISIRERPAE